jgi:TolA-binding protein
LRPEDREFVWRSVAASGDADQAPFAMMDLAEALRETDPTEARAWRDRVLAEHPMHAAAARARSATWEA